MRIGSRSVNDPGGVVSVRCLAALLGMAWFTSDAAESARTWCSPFIKEVEESEYRDRHVTGSELTWGYLGDAWASAVNTPWRYWKKESFEGGIHTPFIMHWPDGFRGKENTLNHGVGHVMDLLPTCLDVAGVDYPETFKGRNPGFLDGKSLIPMIRGGESDTHDTLFWEHSGGKAVRLGNWKMAALKGEPWELFDLSKDRTEAEDLVEDYPERVKEMTNLWEEWAKKMERSE
jgi:arylsulfatase